MAGIYFQIKKSSSIFAIQMTEMILASTFLITSFEISGYLIYNDFFPFGKIDGILLYALATAVGAMMLAIFKYFNFLNLSFSSMISKSVSAVLILHFSLIIFLYFSTAIKLCPFYFIVAAFIQIVLLLFIKIFTGKLKNNIIQNRISLIVAEKQDLDEMVNALIRQGAKRISSVSIDNECLYKYIDNADNIYLKEPNSIELKHKVLAYCALQKKTLYVVPEIHEIAMKNSEMTKVNDLPLFTIGSFQLSEAQAIVKRIMDIVIAIVGIVLSSPILLIAAALIKAEDGGPVFFRQIRCGFNRKEFNLIKLRSMMVDAEKNTGPVLACKKDARITRIGRVLRASRIDEIPQFFNVLTGSMSIVGPRPERPVFVEKYIKDMPDYIHRFSVKPGITGLAQIWANYTSTAENKLKFDLIYIKKYSLLYDIVIIVKTLKTVLCKEQAEGVSTKVNRREYDYSPGKGIGESVPIAYTRTNLYKNYNFLKTAVLLGSCLIVIMTSLTLRYSSITMTLIQAATEPYQVENEADAAVAMGYTIEIMDEEAPGGAVPTDLASIKTGNRNIETLPWHMDFMQKIQATYLVLKKMPSDDLLSVEELAHHGLSAEEAGEVKSILSKNFNQSELLRLKAIMEN